MIETIKQWAGTVALMAIALLVLVGWGASSPSFGGTTNFDHMDVTDGYAINGINVVDSARNAAFAAGTFTGTITHGSNSATSTLALRLFCVEFYATSSATVWNIKPKLDGLTGATTTPFVSGFGGC